MAKKIVLSIASCLLILLVLSLALVIILSSQEFFGQAITWLLCACVGILIVFDLYLSISRIIDAVRHRNSDEEAISERHIEKILSSGETVKPKAVPSPSPSFSEHNQEKTSETKRATQAAEDAKEMRRQATKQRKDQEEQAHKLAGAQAKVQRIEAAEDAARKRADAVSSKEEQRIALAEAEALNRAALEAQQKLAADTAAHNKTHSAAIALAEAETQAAEQRKAHAIENARKQAESMAIARRRAAQQAARSQTFPAITSDKIPTFNTEIMKKVADATESPLARSRATSSYRPQPGEAHGGESIWEKMKVRQSAAPILGQETTGFTSYNTIESNSGTQEMPDEKFTRTDRVYSTPPRSATPPVVPVANSHQPHSPPPVPTARPAREVPAGVPRSESFRPDVARSTTPPPAPNTPRTAPPPAEDPMKTQSAGWAYAPAKLPNAWKTVEAGRKIPGDMSFAGVPVTPSFAPQSATTTAAPPARTPAPVAKPATPQETPAKPSAAISDDNSLKRPRGRPPKLKTEEELNIPKRPRGRPPKPKTEEELNMPKRPRGRPPKPKTEEELNMPKRPRGRPPKSPLTAALPPQPSSTRPAEAPKPR